MAGYPYDRPQGPERHTGALIDRLFRHRNLEGQGATDCDQIDPWSYMYETPTSQNDRSPYAEQRGMPETGAEQPEHFQKGPQRKDAYTMFVPDERRRNKMTELAKKEEETYQLYKDSKNFGRVSYVGTVGGGEVTEPEARKQQARDHLRASFIRRQKSQQWREQQKQQEECEYQKKKDLARKKSEENTRRDTKRQQHWSQDHSRKNAAFLDRQEKESKSRACSQSTAASTTVPSANYESNEEALLEQAIQMSMQPSVTVEPVPDFSSMSEEEQMALAIQRSLQNSGDGECTDLFSELACKRKKEQKSSSKDTTAEKKPDNGLPPHWDEMTPGSSFRLVTLSETSDEYLQVFQQFYDTMVWQWAQIQSIQRVQNPILWQFFTVKKEQMSRENDGQTGERQLFHGTKRKLIDSICKNNFDWRVCGTNGTMYGQGSYFAKDAADSHVYTDRPEERPLPLNDINLYTRLLAFQHVQPGLQAFQYLPVPMQSTTSGVASSSSPNNLHTHVMFLARVLVGQYTRGNEMIRKPPPFHDQDPYGKSFDSCVDNEQDPKIFVVFDSAQCYPEYIIHYIPTN